MQDTINENTVKELNDLPDEKIKERADEALERFKNKLKKYSSE